MEGNTTNNDNKSTSNTTKGKEKVQPSKKEEVVVKIVEPTYGVSQISNMKGLDSKITFYLNRKYKNGLKTSKEWDEIFKNDNLI
jgi:hypothetical protein